MGMPIARFMTSLALLLSWPLQAQVDSATYQVNYKRFTRNGEAQVKDEALGRLEWFRERMGGELGPDFTRNLLREAEAERSRYPSMFRQADGSERFAAINGSTWVSIGPASATFAQNGRTLNKVDSGRLRTILPDPSDASGNTVYVLASGGGLWKTTTFTTTCTWTPLTDQIGSTVSGSAAFGRSTSTLFVGAGDPFDSGLGGFMVKSANGGASWSASVPLGSASKIYDIKVDTSQAQDVVLVGTNKGMYRSADAGGTYSAVATIPSTTKVWSLVKTSAGWLAAGQATSGTATDPGSLYLSVDQGQSWTLVSPGIPGAGRTTLAVGLPGDSVVYAFAATASANAPSQLDLFRSGDGGLTWTALGITSKVPTNKNTDSATMDLMDSQAWYNHMILVDPTVPSRNTVYLGGQLSSAKSVDGGTTWTLISNWMAQFGLPYVHADFHCAAFSNLGGTPRLYFGTDGGLFTSTDGGSTWDDAKNKGLVNHLIYTLAANPGVAGSALVGLQDNGTRIRSGSTSTFNQIRGGDGFGVGWAQDVVGPNAVSMSSYVYNAIRRATISPVTDQSNWSSFTTGLGLTGQSSSSGAGDGDDGASYYFVTPIITPPAGSDPSGQAFFTHGNGKTGPNSGKIFKSSGADWSTIGTPGAGGISAGRYVRAVSHGIGVSPVDLQHIAAAGNAGYLLLTANGGGSWTEVFLGAAPATPGVVSDWQGYNANIAWANNNLLYVCSESPNLGTGAVRVAKSTNGGTTWTAAAGGLPDVPVTKLLVDPGDATGNTVYAATWLGVYRTTDGGSSWARFGNGLPQGRATDLWIAPDSSSLRVATWGRGVWEMTVPTAVRFLSQPASVTAAVGHTATFTAVASGSGTLAYQWSRGGSIIPGANASSYTTPTLALSDSGASFTCTVTGDLGPVTSNPAILTVLGLASAVTSSNATPTALPDLPAAPVEIPFPINGVLGTVGEVQFSLYLTHTCVSDLVISLVHPDGTAVVMSNNAGNGTPNAGAAFGTSCSGYLTFSDLGAASIDSQTTAPLTGTFRPSSPLAAFNGKPVSGTWKLRIQDIGPGDVGTFNCGALTVKPFAGGKTLDLNGDGSVDLRDLLFFAKHFGATGVSAGSPAYGCDLNDDGVVTDADLTTLLNNL